VGEQSRHRRLQVGKRKERGLRKRIHLEPGVEANLGAIFSCDSYGGPYGGSYGGSYCGLSYRIGRKLFSWTPAVSLRQMIVWRMHKASDYGCAAATKPTVSLVQETKPGFMGRPFKVPEAFRASYHHIIYNSGSSLRLSNVPPFPFRFPSSPRTKLVWWRFLLSSELF
jgi:hypothetical protein